MVHFNKNIKVKLTLSSRTYHHGDLKSALIQAAITLLKEKGIQALSLRTLASKVGVSHMAPYAHFKNKTELFQSIAAYGFKALGKKMEAVEKRDNPSKLILEYGTQYIEFAIANAPLYRLMLSQTQVTGPQAASSSAAHMSDELKSASRHPHFLLRDAFASLNIDKGALNIRAQGAWALVHGMSALIIDGHMIVPENMSIKNFLAAAVLQIPTQQL